MKICDHVGAGPGPEIESRYLAIKPSKDSGASLCRASRAILKSKEAASYLTANLTIRKEGSVTFLC